MHGVLPVLNLKSYISRSKIISRPSTTHFWDWRPWLSCTVFRMHCSCGRTCYCSSPSNLGLIISPYQDGGVTGRFQFLLLPRNGGYHPKCRRFPRCSCRNSRHLVHLPRMARPTGVQCTYTPTIDWGHQNDNLSHS